MLATQRRDRVLEAAGAIDGRNPFPEPVLDVCRALVPCDVVAYHEQFEPWNAPEIRFCGDPVGAMTQEIRISHRRYRSQDPLAPADGARKLSDVVSRRDYQRLELYQYADRPLGIEYMMRLWIDPRGAGGVRLEVDRSVSDFDERDRAVLDVLLPHLRQFRRAAAFRRRLPAPGSSVVQVTEREREVLAHVAAGCTNAEIAWELGISVETVRKHLEKAYAKLGVHTRTGAVAALFQREEPTDEP